MALYQRGKWLSYRAQMALSLRADGSGLPRFASYSAGTETKPKINPDAVRLMKKIYGINMEETQTSKLLQDIPPVDIVVTMGCNVACPYLACSKRVDWGLEDPSGKSDEAFIEVIRIIEEKILDLRQEVLNDANK